MYKQDRAPIQIKGSAAFKAATAKGWSAKPLTPASDGQGGGQPPGGGNTPSAPQGGAGQGGDAGAGGGGGQQPDPLAKVGMGEAFGRGVNPFHQPPSSGLPSFGDWSDVPADMLNIRESAGMIKAGNLKGGLAMDAGTLASLAGPEIVKGIGKGLQGAKLLPKEGGLGIAAASRAKGLMRQIGGTIKDARLSETLVTPLHNHLNQMFEGLHKAMDGSKIPLSNRAKSLIIDVVRNNPDAAKELGELYRETGKTITTAAQQGSSKVVQATRKLGKGVKEVVRDTNASKTANTLRDSRYAVRQMLEYRDADKLVTRLKSMAREHPALGKIAEEIDNAVDGVAKTMGKLDERTQLKGYWAELKDIESKAATGVQRSVLRAMLSKVSRGAVSTGEGKISEDAIKQANDLMRRMQGKAKRDVIEQIGKVSEKAGKAWQAVPPAYRAIISGFNAGPNL
jgi:hypothetical protein